MGSSQRYFEYARERTGTQDLLFEMAKVWINVALVESDVAKQAAVDRFVAKRTLHP